MTRVLTHRLGWTLIALALTGFAAPMAFGYGYYQYGNGRADFAARYDVAGTTWAGQGNATYFGFGEIRDFSAANRAAGDFPAFFSQANVQAAFNTATTDWEKWINVTFAVPLDTDNSGAGNVRLFFDTGQSGAYVWGYQHPHPGVSNFAEMHFGATAPGGVAWNATNFTWTVRHELGHVLGLDDMYPYNTARPLPEDFVDHVVAGNPNPQREYASLQDNLMYQYNPGNNYATNPSTIIDNDEIAGVAWLWGSKYNQIVTGDLEGAWNASARRGSREHHGDNQGNGQAAGTWDYRVSFSSNGGGGNPYVDLDFAGYQNFNYTLYGANGGTTVTESVPDAGKPNIHRFTVNQAGFIGNLFLAVNSSFTAERRIMSWVNGGGRTDNFVLPVNTSNLTYDGGNNWAVVFGPMGGDAFKDYGDLPDSYKTTLAANGPRYTEGTSQRIGTQWDSEPDGQPTPYATGDDQNQSGYGGPNDEDGVLFGSNWVDVTLTVDRTGDNFYSLRAWWDTNLNGQFDHGDEMYINDTLTLSDARTETFHYTLGFNPRTFPSRFRFTWIDDPNGISGGVSFSTDITPWGEFLGADAISHGEVQDYAVPEPATLSVLATGMLLLLRRRSRA